MFDQVEIPYGCYWSTPFVRWQGALQHLHAIKFAAHVASREPTPAKLSTVTRKIYDMVRELVPYLDHDVSLTDHIEAAANLLRNGRLLEALPDGDLDWEL